MREEERKKLRREKNEEIEWERIKYEEREKEK